MASSLSVAIMPVAKLASYAARTSSSSKQSVEITVAAQNAYHCDAGFARRVEDDIVADRETSDVARKFFARSAQQRRLAK